MIRRVVQRRGYALLLVLVFVLLFGAMLGVAWRRVASVLRVETVLAVQRQADNGSLPALAQAMRLLETRLRLDADGVAKIVDADSQLHVSYTCKTAVSGQTYKVVFTARNSDGTQWSVAVTVAQAGDMGLPDMPTD